jgi:hypothetical protein
MKRPLFSTSTAIVLSIVASSGVCAQGPVGTQLQIKKDELIEAMLAAQRANKTLSPAELNPGNFQELLLLSLAFAQPRNAAVARDLAKVVEAARVDKQLGSGSSASGSTSVTSKGAVPKILSFAVENGALTRTQSGTTISFKGNPVGLVNSLLAGSLPPRGPLSRIALGIEFDASRGKAEGQPAVFVGDQQQISAVNAKYEVLNHRDPTSRQFQARAKGLYNDARSATDSSTRAKNQRLLAIETKIVATLTTGGAHVTEFANWRASALPALDAARGAEQMAKVLNEQLALLSTQIPFTPDEQDALNQYVDVYASFLQTRDELLELAGKGAVLSIEYVNSRPVDQRTRSTLTLVFETSTPSGKLDLTANASVTALNGSLAEGVDRWPEWAVSSQLDVPIGAIVQGRNLTFTLSGRAEHKPVPPLNVHDTLWLGQGKFTFPVKDGGVKIPLSVTVASRTDLIDKPVVRANIGFTLNLDSLIGK